VKERNLTPLHYACEKGHYGVVKLLLDYNVKVNAKAFRQQEELIQSKTPIEFARDNKHHDVVELLKEHGGEEPVDENDPAEKDPAENQPPKNSRVFNAYYNYGNDVKVASIIREFDGVRARHYFLRFLLRFEFKF
jgi:ankyrin repeat protein